MPINSCKMDKKPGFKWGDSGHCYTYEPDDREGAQRARRQCLHQARAVLASQALAAAEKAVGGVGAPQVTRKKMLGGDERTVVRMGQNEIEIYEQGGRWHLTPNYRTSEGFVAQMSAKDAIARAQMALRDIAQIQQAQQAAARVVRGLPPLAKDILLTTSKRYPPAITLSPKGVEAAQPLVQAGLATINGTRITLTKAGEEAGMNFQGKALPDEAGRMMGSLSPAAKRLFLTLRKVGRGTVSVLGMPAARELEQAHLVTLDGEYVTLTGLGQQVGANYRGKALPPGLSENARKLLALLKAQGGTVTSPMRGVPQVYKELERAGLAVVVNPYALHPQLRITEQGQAA